MGSLPPDDSRSYKHAGAADGDDAALRVTAAGALFASLFAGFGIIDLVTAIAPEPEFEPQRMLAAGWGILFGVVLPLALAAQIRRGGGPIAAAQQIGVVTLAVAVATTLTMKAAELSLVLLLALLTAADVAMHPARSQILTLNTRPNRVLAALTIVAMPPAAIYAVQMAANRRAGIEGDNTLGFDHWTVQSALALCLVLLVGLSALQTDGWRLPAAAAAAGAAGFGLLALMAGDVTANVGTVWAIAAVGWAALITLVVIIQR